MAEGKSPRIGAVAACSLLSASLACTSPPQPPPEPGCVPRFTAGNIVEDDLIVLFREGVTEDQAAKVLSGLHLARPFDWFPRIHVANIKLEHGHIGVLSDVATKLCGNSKEVWKVEPDYKVASISSLDDKCLPAASQDWPLTKIDVARAWSGNWNHSKGDPRVRVGVMDGRVGPLDALGQNLAGGYKYSSGPDLPDWHATSIAAVIGARWDTQSCSNAGLNAEVSIASLRVVGEDVGVMISALADHSHADEYRIDVMSVSLGLTGASSSQVEGLREAIQDAGQAGVLVVAAAGDTNVDVDSAGHQIYPCSLATRVSNLICVAGSDPQDELSSCSSYGATTVGLAAPGESIWAPYASDGDSDLCSWFKGSSMAVPYVAGVAALIRAKCPNASVDNIKQRLLCGDSMSSLSRYVVDGMRLNAFKALSAACSCVSPCECATQSSVETEARDAAFRSLTPR